MFYACHLLIHTFKDSTEIGDFDQLLRNTIDTSTFLRLINISNLIRLRCPSGCKSRWTGFLDISFWRNKKNIKIEQLLMIFLFHF